MNLLKLNSNADEVADMLVKHLYSIDHAHKDILWDAFGDVILNNLEVNLLKQAKVSECNCGEVFKKEGKNQQYCSVICSNKAKKAKNLLKDSENYVRLKRQIEHHKNVTLFKNKGIVK